MLFLKKQRFKFFHKDICFKEIIFAQSTIIVKWYLFGINSYGAISDSKLEKTPNWSSILALSQVTEPLF